MNCYKQLCTEFYDTDKPTAPSDALAFYLSYAEQARGPILEPMCGSGRFLIPLLQRGFDIDGFDASPQMLEACRAKLRAMGLTTNVTQQALPKIELPRRYSLVIIPAGSIGLITDELAFRASLKSLYDVMQPGAKLVMEIDQRKPAKSSEWPWGGRWITRADGARLIISWLGRYDAETSIESSIHRYELVKDGKLLATEIEDFDLRHTDVDEVRHWLRSVGFSHINPVRLFDGKPPRDSDQNVAIECVRPT